MHTLIHPELANLTNNLTINCNTALIMNLYSEVLYDDSITPISKEDIKEVHKLYFEAIKNKDLKHYIIDED